MTDRSMGAYCWDLEPSLIQLSAMMRKGSQAGRQAGQALSIVINGARAKEMGHTGREQRRTKEKVRDGGKDGRGRMKERKEKL